MLDRFSRLARQLRWTYPLLMVTGVLALLFSAWVVIASGQAAESSLLIPAVLVFGWCFLLLSFVNLFRSVPPAPQQQDPFGRRLLRRLHRLTLTLIALGFIALTVAMAVVSLKLLSLWSAA